MRRFILTLTIQLPAGVMGVMGGMVFSAKFKVAEAEVASKQFVGKARRECSFLSFSSISLHQAYPVTAFG